MIGTIIGALSHLRPYLWCIWYGGSVTANEAGAGGGGARGSCRSSWPRSKRRTRASSSTLAPAGGRRDQPLAQAPRDPRATRREDAGCPYRSRCSSPSGAWCANNDLISKAQLVGATGIEPVTPTMSIGSNTFSRLVPNCQNSPKRLYFKLFRRLFARIG
jgi:hypothetical protein